MHNIYDWDLDIGLLARYTPDVLPVHLRADTNNVINDYTYVPKDTIMGRIEMLRQNKPMFSFFGVHSLSQFNILLPEKKQP